MQRKLVQATATAVLFATMAMPALAGNGKEHENKGNAFGRIFAEIRKELKSEIKKEKREAREEKRHDDDDEDEDAIGVCLKAAELAHEVAIKAANAERKTSLDAARTTYRTAISAAQKTRHDALMSALVTFKASDMGSSAQAVFIAAYVKAHADWQTAKNAAQPAWDAAKVAAEAKWKAAKIKADADFKLAKEKCKQAAPAPTPTTDVTAPSATTLTISGATASSILVGWTAPGDDAATGAAASYDLRYSTSPIATAADFNAATQVAGEPTPAVAGTSQSMTVSGLAASTTYYFALKSQDEVSNVSAMSNVPSLATLVAPDVTAPAAIANLSLSAATSSSALLTWTASGDDGSTGTAASYDIRYSTSPIATAADFTAATQVAAEPTPVVAGLLQTMTVTGLTANTTYHFAMKVQDEVPNVSAMSNVQSIVTLP